MMSLKTYVPSSAAAACAVQVLTGEGSGPFRGRTFLGCDNHPVTFRVRFPQGRSYCPTFGQGFGGGMSDD